MRRLFVCFLPLVFCAGLATSAIDEANAAQDPPADADVQKFEAVTTFLRNWNAQDYSIASPNEVDDQTYVEVGGIQQWITVRGEDRSNPVMSTQGSTGKC